MKCDGRGLASRAWRGRRGGEGVPVEVWHTRCGGGGDVWRKTQQAQRSVELHTLIPHSPLRSSPPRSPPHLYPFPLPAAQCGASHLDPTQPAAIFSVSSPPPLHLCPFPLPPRLGLCLPISTPPAPCPACAPLALTPLYLPPAIFLGSCSSPQSQRQCRRSEALSRRPRWSTAAAEAGACPASTRQSSTARSGSQRGHASRGTRCMLVPSKHLAVSNRVWNSVGACIVWDTLQARDADAHMQPGVGETPGMKALCMRPLIDHSLPPSLFPHSLPRSLPPTFVPNPFPNQPQHSTFPHSGDSSPPTNMPTSHHPQPPPPHTHPATPAAAGPHATGSAPGPGPAPSCHGAAPPPARRHAAARLTREAAAPAAPQRRPGTGSRSAHTPP
eukprot:214343-Chlamydomonas_euryale.AAC.2